MATVKLSKIIAPTFAGVHRDIKQHQHTHYWLKGGRGSTKSSFISVEIPLGIPIHKREVGFAYKTTTKPSKTLGEFIRFYKNF